MEILSTEMPGRWLDGARREWATSVVVEPSESGIVEPVAQQLRPFLRFTFNADPRDSAALENLFIEANGPEKGFLCKAPLVRDHRVTGVPIGTATGSAQALQLKIKRGQTWDMLYPIDGTITLYANATPLVQGTDWTLGLLGAVTVTATLGAALTIDADYKTAFRLLENSQVTLLEKGVIQTVQQVSIEEIP